METVLLGIDAAIEEAEFFNRERKSQPLFNRGKAIVSGYISVKELLSSTDELDSLYEKIQDAMETAKTFSRVGGTSGCYYSARLQALQYVMFNLKK